MSGPIKKIHIGPIKAIASFIKRNNYKNKYKHKTKQMSEKKTGKNIWIYIHV